MGRQSRVFTIIGWSLTILVSLLLGFSASMKLMRAPEAVKGFTEEFGYPESVIIPIGIVEVACMLIYLFPKTSVLGAVLLTGYLGGACATHVRVEDPAFIGGPIVGIVAWLGLFFRDPRIRDLMPFRTSLKLASSEAQGFPVILK